MLKKITWLVFIGCLTILKVSAQERSIVITIDDLLATPADLAAYTYISENILKTLVKNNIKAIGFVNESRLYTHDKPDSTKIKVLEKWLKAGMDLGNHTFSHVYINNTSISAYKTDVIKGELITRPLMEKYNKILQYFRHPQLRTGPTDEYRKELTKFLKNKGYTIAPVTIDNDEYMYAYCYAYAHHENKSELMEKIGEDYLRYMEKIFVFYEKLSKDFLGYDLPQTLLIHANLLNADYLAELVEMIYKRGYVFIELDEALLDDAYALPVGTHARGLSWIQRWMIFQGLKPELHPPVSKFITDLYNDLRS